MNQVRDDTFDVVKGIAIILMVFAHAAQPEFEMLRGWIYLFHMPVFFVLAGWFFNWKYADSWRSVLGFVAKKMRRLWLPFCIWSIIFILLHNWFVHIGIYTDKVEFLQYARASEYGIKHCFSMHEIVRQILSVPIMTANTQIGGAMWFLRTLFYALVVYCFIAKIFKKNIFFLTVFSLVTIFLGKYVLMDFVTVRGSFIWVPHVCTALALIHMGAFLRKFDMKLRFSWGWGVIVSLFMFMLSCVSMVGLSENKFPSVVFLFVGTVLGWTLLRNVACVAFTGRHFVGLIGQKYTMAILLLHFLAFKIVTLVVVKCYGLPSFLTAAYPTLFGGVGWSLLYTIAGVGIPIVLNVGWDRLILVAAQNKCCTLYNFLLVFTTRRTQRDTKL